MTRMKTFPISVLAGLASLLAGFLNCALASPKVPVIEGSMPWLAMTCSAVALVGVCVVAFKKPNRAKGD